MAVLPVTKAAPEIDLQSLVEAERAFARAALERGIHQSFLENLADDSIIFAPGPTKAKEFYTKYNDKDAVLIWEPIFATIARSGDLGLTTGPWQLKKSKKQQGAAAFGEFVSLWNKQGDGKWKVIVDVGIEHAAPTGFATTQFKSPAAATAKPGDLGTVAMAFNENLKTDAHQAILHYAADDIRLLRGGAFPLVGKPALQSAILFWPKKQLRNSLENRISNSNDLAFDYGSYREEASAPAGFYLTVWQLIGTGEWKILLDLLKPAQSSAGSGD